MGDEFWDAGERANGWPETVLADCTLCDVIFFCERDTGEEGEEVGGCFSFDLGRVSSSLGMIDSGGGRTFTHKPCFDFPGHLYPVGGEDVIYLRDQSCADGLWATRTGYFGIH